MSSVLDPPRSSPYRPPRPKLLVAGVAIAVVALGLLFAAQQLLPTTSSVRRITVTNPTPFHLEIDATGVGKAHSVTLGAIGREQDKTFDDVIDQGDQWIFRFSSGATAAGEMRIPRSQLEQSDWKLTVSPDVANRLRTAGVPESPRE